MALQLWLPLMENINNQGLCDASIDQTGVSYTSSKFGKSATFSNSYISIKNTPITGNISDFSFSFWMKNSNSQGTACLYNGRTVTGGACGIFTLGGAFRFDDGAQHSISYTIPQNKWEHYCFTRNSENISLYVNGSLVNTVSSVPFTCSATNATIGASSANSLVGQNNFLIGQLCDYRIYDHCLSPREVKEISKGLFCHYPLNDLYGENLIKGCYKCELTNSKRTVSGSAEFILSNDEIMKLQGKTLVFSYYYSAEGERLPLPNTTTYMADRFGCHGSFKYINTKDTTTQLYPFASSLTIAGTGRTIMKWTVPNDIKSIVNNLGFSIQTNYAKPADGNENTWYIKDLKLEVGNDATAWCPNSQDNIYSYGYGNSVTYDVSGFNNNSISNKLADATPDIDSPRYDLAYNFSRGSYINTTNFSFENIPQGTMNIWINRHVQDSKWRTYLMFANFYNWTGSEYDFIILGSTGGQNIVMDCCSNLVQYNIELNKWYMFTITWDLTTHTAKYYINGEIVRTTVQDRINTTYASKHNSHYLGGTYTDTTDSDFSMSDFRLYNTTLSDDDVRLLYNSPISVTNNGMLMTQGEFKEND